MICVRNTALWSTGYLPQSDFNLTLSCLIWAASYTHTQVCYQLCTQAVAAVASSMWDTGSKQHTCSHLHTAAASWLIQLAVQSSQWPLHHSTPHITGFVCSAGISLLHWYWAWKLVKVRAPVSVPLLLFAVLITYNIQWTIRCYYTTALSSVL